MLPTDWIAKKVSSLLFFITWYLVRYLVPYYLTSYFTSRKSTGKEIHWWMDKRFSCIL